MKHDIENRNDILNLLKAFYSKVFTDELIGFFFTDVVPLNLETHIPVIADFWESILFGKQQYRKNVMAIHQHISDLFPIKKEHLDRWVLILMNTIDDMYSGYKAELMKQRARSIATIMQIKII